MIGSQEKVMRVQHFVLELCCPYCKKDNSHYSNLQIEVISAAVVPPVSCPPYRGSAMVLRPKWGGVLSAVRQGGILQKV